MFVLTPFQLIYALLLIAVFAFLGFLVLNKHYRTAVIVAFVWVLLLFTTPFRLKSTTEQYNTNKVQQFEMKVLQDLRNSQERITVPRESYDDFLNRKNQQLKENSPPME